MPDAFHDRLAGLADRIETRLDAILSGADVPPRLLAAMRHAALGGGKRLRPFLLVEAAAVCGGGEGGLGDVIETGAAIELVHVYSLVHDDLPAMDDDDLRRGRPTAHRAFDEATAILAGDALQTLAFERIAAPATHPDAAVRAELVVILARAAGAAGMAGGQMLDLAAEGRFGDAPSLAPDLVRHLQALKTGALLAAAVRMGAVMAGAAVPMLDALDRYGRALGAAFQVADDILDIESSSAALGKATGKDAGRGKATLVGVLGLDAARAERDRLADEAAAALADFGPEAEILRAAARFAAERRL